MAGFRRMTTTAVLRRLATSLGISLVLMACHETPTEAAGLFHVAIATDRALVSSTEAATLTVTITNLDRRAIFVPDPRGFCGPPFRVFDDADREIHLPDRVCTLVGYPPVTLRAGESIVLRARWDGTARGETRSAVRVPSGAYRLMAKVFLAQHEYTGGSVAVTVEHGS